MNNREAVVATLARHREARQWTDQAVADDLLQQLDLNPTGEASKARLLVDPNLITEDEVVAHEAAAKLAVEKAKEARDKLNAQKADEAQHPDVTQTPAQIEATRRQRELEAQRQVPPSAAPGSQQQQANEANARESERLARIQASQAQAEVIDPAKEATLTPAQIEAERVAKIAQDRERGREAARRQAALAAQQQPGTPTGPAPAAP